MGRSYTVPRSAKGETRILYIFSLKSLALTLIFLAIGFLITFFVGKFVEIGFVTNAIIVGSFALVGYVIGAAKIPDSPIMGPLQKAGGEEILTILLRLITFGKRKKIYVYGLTRERNDVKLDDNKKEGILGKLKI
jgi:hypothetical protein